jgi:hypothetical protein
MPQPSATTTRRVSANTRRFSLESEYWVVNWS